MDLSNIRFFGDEPARPPGRPPSHVAAARSRPAAQSPAAERLTSPLALATLRAAGLDPGVYRPAPLVRRVPACVRAIRAGTEEAACRALAVTPARTEPMLSTLLLGVSAFFRDEAVFELLARAVVPGLPADRPIRVLSVGCSHGAELYSVAMLLDDAGRLDQAELVGVDCRAEALDQARAALFDDAAVAALDAATRARHFVENGRSHQPAARLRARTTWVCADATRHVPPGPWDLVLCRNLAMYLVPAASDALFVRLTRHLVPGGHLVVGKAERPPAGLPLTMLGRCVHVRRAD
jgi:chemotaxis methyl-accepting protein methylase